VVLTFAPPVTNYTIGGTVSGLANGLSVVLQNNGSDSKTVSADGAFTFSTPVSSGSAYAVTVLTNPNGQICTVTNGSGTATGDVANVSVSCRTVVVPTQPVPTLSEWAQYTMALLMLVIAGWQLRRTSGKR